MSNAQEKADKAKAVISAQIREGGVLGESLVNTASAHAIVRNGGVWFMYATETILLYPDEFYDFWNKEIVPVFYDGA